MNTINGMNYTDRDLIMSIVGNFYILDYGYITKVNQDKTVNVTHCTRLVNRNGEQMPVTTTKELEVLTISSGGFSMAFDYAPGDKVLLLGLKNIVKSTKDANQAEPAVSYMHYTRETMKALPLCAFDSSAKVKLEADKGSLKITTEEKIELNGSDKQLVTWGELDRALSLFLTQLTSALTSTPITGNGSPQPTWVGLPSSIDISAAKTTTVVTGG